MYLNTSGIVLREVKYGDNSKILTVLTGSEGKLTVSAHGAYRKNSKLAAAAGLLVFSHMTLTKRKERWTLTEAQTVEQFTGLRDEIAFLSLGTYMAELTETLADEDSPNAELLPLLLNALYVLSEKIKPPSLVKPAFELRLMSISGYKPVLEEPAGTRESYPASESGESVNEGIMTLSPGAHSAAKYILTCGAKKVFSFNLDGNALKELASITENYLLRHLDRSFKTLEYYKRISEKILDL